MSILARIRDFVHECEIAYLYNRHVRATEHGTCAQRRATWLNFQRAVYLRSAEQILRMRKAR